MYKLGQQLQATLVLGIAPELVASIVTTSNPKRLQALFIEASERLLAAHQDVRQRPGSVVAAQQRLRRKMLVDLVRARMAIVGHRKPTVERLMQMLQRVPENVVNLRKVA